MDRHWDANGAASAPAVPANVLGPNVYPQGGASPSQPGPWWYHMITEEIRGVITAASIMPDRSNLTQLSAAIQAMISSLAPKIPAGTVVYVATNTAPDGYLKANGAAVSRATYAALFAAIVTNAGFTSQNFTSTIATPGVFTKAAHGFVGGERLRLSTTGVLPTGLDNSIDYFVEVIDANTFYLNTSAFVGGTRVATSGIQSGTHSYTRSWFGLGDGASTFNLPDLRSEFLRGFDDSRGVDTQHAFGSNQKGSFANLGAGPTADCSTTYTTVNGSLARYDLGYDLPSVADYANARVEYVTPTGNSSPSDVDMSYGTSRPRNIALLACIKY